MFTHRNINFRCWNMKYLSLPLLTFIKIPKNWNLYIFWCLMKKKVDLKDTKLRSAHSCIKPSVIQQLPQTFHTRTLHMYYSWTTFIEVLTKVSFYFFFLWKCPQFIADIKWLHQNRISEALIKLYLPWLASEVGKESKNYYPFCNPERDNPSRK